MGAGGGRVCGHGTPRGSDGPGPRPLRITVPVAVVLCSVQQGSHVVGREMEYVCRTPWNRRSLCMAAVNSFTLTGDEPGNYCWLPHIGRSRSQIAFSEILQR